MYSEDQCFVCGKRVSKTARTTKKLVLTNEAADDIVLGYVHDDCNLIPLYITPYI